MTVDAATVPDQPREFPIPLARWTDFETKFAKLNRRAKRLGCPPCSYQALRDEVHKRERPGNGANSERRTYSVPVRIVTVTGAAPRLADWQLVARVEPLEEHNLIHTLPGIEQRVDQRFRTLGADVCEHCHTSRARKDVFIVRHADGRERQVGRQCLADFTGINSPERAAQQAVWLCSMRDLCEDAGWFGGLWSDHVPTDEVLQLASFYIRTKGWQPRTGAVIGCATADQVADHFAGAPKTRARANETLRKGGGINDDDRARAAATLQWIAGELAAKANRSDYEENLVTLVVNDLTKHRHIGIICAAVASYLKAKTRAEERRAEREQLKQSRHVGEVGERLRGLPVRVLAVRPMSSDWGPSTLVKMLTEDGCVLTWFASGDWHLEPGATGTIAGTVKRHTEYQGIRETQLSRVTGLQGKARGEYWRDWSY